MDKELVLLEDEFNAHLESSVIVCEAINYTKELVGRSKRALNKEYVSSADVTIAKSCFENMTQRLNIRASKSIHLENNTDPRLQLNEYVLHMEGFIDGAKEVIIKIWEKLKEILAAIKNWIVTNYGIVKTKINAKLDAVKSGKRPSFREAYKTTVGTLDEQTQKKFVDSITKEIKTTGQNKEEQEKNIQNAVDRFMPAVKGQIEKAVDDHSLADGLTSTVDPLINDIAKSIQTEGKQEDKNEIPKEVTWDRKSPGPLIPEWKTFTFQVNGSLGTTYEVKVLRNFKDCSSNDTFTNFQCIMITTKSDKNSIADPEDFGHIMKHNMDVIRNAVRDTGDLDLYMTDGFSDNYTHALNLKLTNLEFTEKAYKDTYKKLEYVIAKASENAADRQYADALKQILQVLNKCSAEYLKGF